MNVKMKRSKNSNKCDLLNNSYYFYAKNKKKNKKSILENFRLEKKLIKTRPVKLAFL